MERSVRGERDDVAELRYRGVRNRRTRTGRAYQEGEMRAAVEACGSVKTVRQRKKGRTYQEGEMMVVREQGANERE
jgi:hypothetical protein